VPQLDSSKYEGVKSFNFLPRGYTVYQDRLKVPGTETAENLKILERDLDLDYINIKIY
jgi:hypothetical protein